MGRGGLPGDSPGPDPLPARPGTTHHYKTMGVLFDAGAAAMLLWNDHRHPVDANSAACSLLQRSKSKLLSLSLDGLTESSALQNLEALVKGLADNGVHNGFHIFNAPNGAGIHVSYSATANILPGVHLGIFHPHSNRSEQEELSERERDILTLLAHGENNKTIAQELFLAPETIRNYTRSARIKLGARSRSHAIALAIASGQIVVDP